MRVVDLFSGAGGLTLGAIWAGADVLCGIDVDRKAAQTYRTNFPTVKFIEQDIRRIELQLLSGLGQIDVVIAGPPCQSFSTSNQKTRFDENPLNSLLYEPIRFISAVRPRAAVIENVHGLAIGSRAVFLKRMVRRIKRLDKLSCCPLGSSLLCASAAADNALIPFNISTAGISFPAWNTAVVMNKSSMSGVFSGNDLWRSTSKTTNC